MNKQATRKKTAVHIRPYHSMDIGEIEFIEQTCRKFPWPGEKLERVANARMEMFLNVAEIGNRIVGFSLHRGHATCIQILTMGVHPDFRRMGVGTQLLMRVRQKLSQTRNRLVIDVHENDFNTLAFLHHWGFIHGSRLRDRYPDGSDAYRWEFYR